jgi:hypothetical protein
VNVKYFGWKILSERVERTLTAEIAGKAAEVAEKGTLRNKLNATPLSNQQSTIIHPQ